MLRPESIDTHYRVINLWEALIARLSCHPEIKVRNRIDSMSSLVRIVLCLTLMALAFASQAVDDAGADLPCHEQDVESVVTASDDTTIDDTMLDCCQTTCECPSGACLSGFALPSAFNPVPMNPSSEPVNQYTPVLISQLSSSLFRPPVSR